MRTVIVDDEQEAREALHQMLQLFCPEIKIVGMASNLPESLDLISTQKPELVFLDIDLGGHSGFDLLQKLKVRNFQTVFVTAFDQYAIQAIRINALDYIMKPINPDDLIQAVKKAGDLKTAPSDQAYESLLESRRKGEFDKIGVSTSQGISFIELNKIIRLESEDNYTHIHLDGENPLLISKTIKSFEEILPKDRFIRCHQSHIVHLSFVRGYKRIDGGTLEVVGNPNVPVSRSRRKLVQDILTRYFPSV
ncbi:response regulator transcription factor [bacterium SCSIO 12741]|nr:response regulator transcription factor [bacterium SCSIO 12741]